MIDEDFNFTHDGSPAFARKSLQVSLKNLGVDYIDLYILRSKDPNIPIEESVKAMAVSIAPFASAQCNMRTMSSNHAFAMLLLSCTSQREPLQQIQQACRHTYGQICLTCHITASQNYKQSRRLSDFISMLRSW